MELYLLDKSYMDLEYIDNCFSFFLWFYYQLLFKSLSRLWFDCLFTRGTDQSISSKEEFTTIILFIYLHSIWLVVNLLVLKMISEMHDLQVFFFHTLLSLLLYSSWLLSFELRNTKISHTDLFQHEYLQAEITFRYYLNIVSN